MSLELFNNRAWYEIHFLFKCQPVSTNEMRDKVLNVLLSLSERGDRDIYNINTIKKDRGEKTPPSPHGPDLLFVGCDDPNINFNRNIAADADYLSILENP